MSESVQRMDELIRDYLLYRGLTNSLKSFDAELKNDKDKGFRADKILEQLLGFISTFDLLGLKNYWEHLERRIFSHLEYTHAHNVNKLRISVLRLYVVNAIQSNRTDRVTEFFEKLIPEIQSQVEWKEWFVLPYLRNPEQSPLFSLYFSKQWEETLKISLHNFLSIIFQSMPLPILMNFDAEHQKIVDLQEENAKLQDQVIKLTDQVAKYEDQMGRLQEQVRQLSLNEKSESPDVSDQSSNSGTGESQAPPLKSSLKATSKKSPSPNVGRRLLSSSSSTPATVGSKTVRGALSSLLGPKKNQDQSQQVSKTKEGGGGGGSSVGGGGGVGGGGKKVDFASSSPTHQPAQTSSQNQVRLQQQHAHDKQRQELFSKSQQSQTQQSQAHHAPKAAEKTPSGVKEVELSSFVSSKPEASQGSPSHGSQPPNVSKKPSPSSTFFPGEEESLGTFLILSQDEYTEHHSSITYSRFSPSSTSVASMDIDGVVKVWKTTPNPTTLATIMFKAPLLSLEWVPKTDRMLILGSSVGSIKLYDCDGKKPIKEAEMDAGFPRVVSIACNPSGTTFVCSSASQVAEWGSDLSKPGSPLHGACKLTTWDLKTLKLHKELPLARSAGCINCTSFNHNGNLLVTGAGDGMVRLFDIQRQECLLSWRAHQGQVYATQFSPAETSVYSMGSDGKYTEWSIHKVGQKLMDMPIHDGATGPFVVSGFGGYRQQQNPRGKLFAFDSSGNYVLTCAPHGGVIYKLNKEKGMLRTLTILGHRTPVVSVDWCTTLNTGVCLSGSMDGRVQVTTLLSQ
ncbi:WD repeat-containing protein 91 [Strongylocentrotus purpuratus]|uniref:WD repeat-containing protein 91 n=1 Tax=Strongylocentrotus purpuratus TaxID=7668 RepID=A0A7M7NW68_STRPU|nr:WD repeat-containing protein 91 [Strongylocentrotus purpuratus]